MSLLKLGAAYYIGKKSGENKAKRKQDRVYYSKEMSIPAAIIYLIISSFLIIITAIILIKIASW